jgi:1-phosphofructokinase family hexose kinase
MIVTLTPNTALDYTVVVPRLAPHATLRASEHAWGMGGKAADAAWILGKLGQPVLALGCAAGATGARMEVLLREHGVITDFTPVDGETRLNVVVVTGDGSGQSTLTVPSLRVSPEQLARLEARYRAALEAASCVVLGGSLPAGMPADFFAGAIGQARARGLPVIFDASGPALRGGLAGEPTLIKPNRDELGELLGEPDLSPKAVAAAARRLQAAHGCDVVVTLGAAGAVAVLGERAYRVPPLRVPVASTAGAGDGVLAGLALAHSQGAPPEDGLRHGFALAGAIVQTLATADFNVADYQALLPRVQLVPLV